MAAGNGEGAERLAKQALADKNQDAGRAAFILARTATLRGDMQGAEFYFEKAIKGTQDPKTVAWSHIYLARIADLKDDRDLAVEHYKAALAENNAGAEARSAAEKGLETPYAAPKTAPKK